MESAKGFQKLIKSLPKNFQVLDIGGGGLQGENTTDDLVEHFGVKNYTGVCYSHDEIERYHAIREEKKLPKLKIIEEDYYTYKGEYFDLVVLDLNVENNMKDWENEFKHLHYLKEGGYLITYIMLTDQYGDEETPPKIKEHWLKFWNTRSLTNQDIGRKHIQGFEVFAHEKEVRRTYILWIMLRKTSGS